MRVSFDDETNEPFSAPIERALSKSAPVPRAPAEPRSFAPLDAPASKAPAGVGLRRPSEPRSFARQETGATTAADTVAAFIEAAITDDRALVVLPCLNEEAFLPGVLDMVLRDVWLTDPLIVVVDGGSTDRTCEIAADYARRDPRVRLLVNPDRIQSAAVNRAIRLADGRRWLVRMDVHMTYPDNYVSRLIDEANHTGANSVVVSMESAPEDRGGLFQRATAAAQNSVLGAGGSAHRRVTRGRWVDHGHHALFKLTDFVAAGGYDETFTHNEDAEFDLRLGQGGGRIWLSDAFRPKYHPRRSTQSLWNQYFNYGKGRARTVEKHASKLKLRQLIPLSVAPAVLVALLSPLHWIFALPALIWLGLCLAYGAYLGSKARDLAAALSGAPAIVMHLAWSAGFWLQALGSRLAPRIAPESAAPPLRASAAPVPRRTLAPATASPAIPSVRRPAMTFQGASATHLH